MGSHTRSVLQLFIINIFVVVLLIVLSGCGKDQTDPVSKEVTPAEDTTSDPYQPGAELPPNHPPMDSSSMPAIHPVEGGGEIAGHPAGAMDNAKEVEVIIPENIKGKWSAVQLIITGADGSASEFTVPIGGQVDGLKDKMVLSVEAFLPDYSSDFEKATSASESLNNPAVLIRLTKQDELLAKGWVFKNYPEFNTFKGSELKIELLEAQAAEKES